MEWVTGQLRYRMMLTSFVLVKGHEVFGVELLSHDATAGVEEVQ